MVVQNWNEAERGIDIMRTDMDGRATFLVHPEPGEQQSPALQLEGAEKLSGGWAIICASPMDSRLRLRICCPAWPDASWRAIAPPLSTFPFSILISSSWLPTASAITAMRSVEARKRVAVPWRSSASCVS